MASIEFLTDIGSPNAYLADRVIRQRGVPVRRTPILLGGLFKLTGGASPIVTDAKVAGKLAYGMLEIERFRRRHGLDAFAMNPRFPINTLQVMRVVVAAERAGTLDTCHAALMAAMWEDGADLGDEGVLRGVLDAGKLDGAGLIAAARTPEVKAALIANTEAAAARGAFGVPTFFVSNEMWFGKDRLDQVFEAAD